MVLESTVICLDNSDWMRNGDYAPRRFDAQMDAAGILCNSRTNSNPENTVGILTMAGQGVEMLVSPTEEIGKILACFARIHINGAHSDLATSVQIAQLALKHRKNKNGGQRIIAFVGGPLQDSVESLQKIGKQLKKNNVAVDVILMGEIAENNEKLQEFVNATNSNDNSHLITVPPGVSPSNALFSSPVMSEHGGAHMMGGFGGGTVGGAGASGSGGAGGGGGGDFDMYGGIDPTMDPELAMAIRSSMEEARAQEESRVNALQKETAGSSSSSAGAAGGGAEPFGGYGATDEEDEEALIQRALEMSMADANSTSSSSGSNNNAVPSAAPSLPSTLNKDGDGVVMRDEPSNMDVDIVDDEDDEEAELRRALQLSVADASGGGVVDSEFVDQLLQGTDLDDPLVQAALAQLNASNNNTNNKEGDNSKKRKGGDDA